MGTAAKTNLCSTIIDRNSSNDPSMYRDILENISDAFALIDKRWRFTYVNQAAVQLIAQPRDQILGRVSWDLFLQTKESRLYTELHRAMEKAIPVHFETLHFPSTVWYECDAYPSSEGLSVFFREITKHKQVEGQLQERLEEIEKLMEFLPLGVIFAHDPQCQYFTGNRAAYELLRLPAPAHGTNPIPLDEIPSPQVYQNGHETSLQKLLLQHTIAPGVEAKELELKLVFDEDEEAAITVYGYISPLFNQQGQARGCVAAFMEITQYNQALDALSESQRRLSAVIEASGASYYEFATDLSQGVIDQRFAETLGYSWEEIPPMSELWHWWETRLHPEDHEQTLQAYQDFIEGVISSFHQKYRMQHKDGSWRWWRAINTTVERSAQGQATTIAGLVFDITEQRQTEEALRKSEGRFRAMAETIPHIIFTSSPDGARDYTNSRFYEYTRLAPESAKNFGWLNALHPKDREPIKTRWLQAMKSGEPFEAQYRLRTAKGGYHWFQGRARPIRNKTGQITKWFGACSDIDDLIRAQESLRESDRAKDEFLAMLGHELRNPLVPIGNAVELMRLHPDKRAIQNKSLDLIDRQVKHLTHLVNDLLNAARIVTGKITLSLEPVNLKEVIMQAIETIQPAIESASHQLTLSLPTRALKVEGDSVRLMQIVANLLDNAIKYTPPGGHIHLQVKRQQGNALIRVQDNGLGFPPEKLATIFDVFAQIDPSADRSQGGLGLGLALVRRIAEAHGGKALASSKGRGQGSEFTITLPLISKTTSRTI